MLGAQKILRICCTHVPLVGMALTAAMLRSPVSQNLLTKQRYCTFDQGCRGGTLFFTAPGLGHAHERVTHHVSRGYRGVFLVGELFWRKSVAYIIPLQIRIATQKHRTKKLVKTAKGTEGCHSSE